MRKKWQNMSVRRAFVSSVCITVLFALLLSLGTIAAGLAFLHWLLPERNTFYLNIRVAYFDGSGEFFRVSMQPGQEILKFGQNEAKIFFGEAENDVPRLIIDEEASDAAERKIKEMEVSLDRVETSYTTLTPKRKLAYMGTLAAMVALPMFYAFLGIILCAVFFYRKKLEPPIAALAEAAEHIGKNDLDFTVSYESKDELGQLCTSFETMRLALEQNNRKLWRMLEDRKILQASIAHDLRNPIAVILGYTEYLQIHLDDAAYNKEQMGRTVQNVEKAARRLERYTDSIRNINQLEELKLSPTECMLSDILSDMAEDFSVMAEQKEISFKVDIPDEMSGQRGFIDCQITFRILENIITNSFRYADSQICMKCAWDGTYLHVEIADDGSGFPEEILRRQKGTLILGSGEHMGMGLTICQLLSRKHGGRIELGNGKPHGARVVVALCVLNHERE